MDVMRDELRRESEAGHIFLARLRVPLGIIALGMVEKVRKGKGSPTVGYLDDFFCVLETKDHAEEVMLMLAEFVTFLGFKVNSAKCEGPSQLLEFLGVLLSTESDVCTIHGRLGREIPVNLENFP
eukprot:gene34189-biopygen18928